MLTIIHLATLGFGTIVVATLGARFPESFSMDPETHLLYSHSCVCVVTFGIGFANIVFHGIPRLLLA
jgi:hypothetical protein